MDSELESKEQSESADTVSPAEETTKTEEAMVEKTEGFGKIGSDNSNFRENMEPSPKKKSMKKLIFVIIILIVFLSLGFFFRSKIKGLVVGGAKPIPSPVVKTPQPTPIPNPLVRSDWSFEVLNGSGVTGLAKKIADKLKELGYPVVKTGNADKDNYQLTQIFVKKELQDKIDLVIADLKDVIKIASVAGELKDSTASARIIIGKDSL